MHPVTGKHYQWVTHPAETELSPAPSWVLGLAASDSKPLTSRQRLELVRNGVAEGDRNVSVARLIGHLLFKGVDTQLASELLLAWNSQRCRPPLSDREVLYICHSISGREQRKWAT